MSIQKNFVIGLMLFALFLGAGNIIFPPLLGQMAGDDLFISMIGFLITGVGLPLLAILAIANAGGGLQTIANRVNPVFGIAFTMIVYLAIGPFFGIPRTATVSYEIGIAPFLPDTVAVSNWPLAVFTVVFFIITIALALNPAKLVDRIGKVLTPVLFLVIGALAVKSIVTPMGDIGQPQGDYLTKPFFRSFVEGYLTMDVIAALVFGIVIINTFKAEGVTGSRAQMKAMIFAGSIAAIGLALVYISLGYIGATSTSVIGIQENGGTVLALASKVLYGSYGSIILAITIIFACLTTSIGLVSACAQYFSEVMPRLSYKTFVFIFAIFSALFANVGLTQLIAISIPVLLMIYPLAIVLVLLSFVDKWFGRKPVVYIMALVPTAFVSIFDGLLGASIDVKPVTSILSNLPLYEQQIGWLVPAIVGALIGLVLSPLFKKRI
ncbi:branched-chain amino acid transport system II carrier protein [Filibacter tadaridae]|uniref:Branched-chain amino acid transport system carrier protein n=1 Tax=Filibacter tadaridae TaxID=2483811 RepID=A0A3P5X223_9BACL|nr:branched-chain amino acid transport system II carrier protein [Filibacter tadaridae]VDC24656.1 Branched-chain amino acid transport system 2 carrier protein [Filibacter tadaridae]